MMVDGGVSGLGSSWICMIGAARTAERVRGTVDEMGWGFRTLLGETSFLSFLAIGFVMNVVLNISLTSLPLNTTFSGSCGNTDNVLFLRSNGCVSIYVEAYLFYAFGLELGPTHFS
jgi:hypothetical protein